LENNDFKQFTFHFKWIVLKSFHNITKHSAVERSERSYKVLENFGKNDVVRVANGTLGRDYTIMDLLPVEYSPRSISDFRVNNTAYLTGNRSITVLLYNKIHVFVNQ
jgi:hypothetical protein